MAHGFCDIQMLRDSEGNYVIKEFCIYNSKWDITNTMMFKSPHCESLIPPNYMRQNNYTTNVIHGIHWNAGDIPFELCYGYMRQLTSSYLYIYVKGEQKRRILQTILYGSAVINIETLGCPKLSVLPRMFVPYHCTEHGIYPHHTCASLNARRIGLWYEMIKAK